MIYKRKMRGHRLFDLAALPKPLRQALKQILKPIEVILTIYHADGKVWKRVKAIRREPFPEGEGQTRIWLADGKYIVGTEAYLDHELPNWRTLPETLPPLKKML